MASPPSHSQNVLPDPEFLVLKQIVQTDNRFIQYVSSRQTAICLNFSRVSRSRHSTYTRRLLDLRWQGQTVWRFISGPVAIAAVIEIVREKSSPNDFRG
jgi:hypothetical protein